MRSDATQATGHGSTVNLKPLISPVHGSFRSFYVHIPVLELPFGFRLPYPQAMYRTNFCSSSLPSSRRAIIGVFWHDHNLQVPRCKPPTTCHDHHREAGTSCLHTPHIPDLPYTRLRRVWGLPSHQRSQSTCPSSVFVVLCRSLPLPHTGAITVDRGWGTISSVLPIF